MKKSIDHQFFFSHPPKAVWEYLTNSELMELWLMKNNFEPVLGHEFQFRINPMPALEFDGIVYCKVLEITPYSRLSYSWKLGPGDGTLNFDSVVKWRLEPKDNGTQLILEHNDFTVLKNLALFDGMNSGWLSNIKKIAARLDEKSHDTTNA